VAPNVESFKAAMANADWANAPGFYQILTDEPGATNDAASPERIESSQPRDRAIARKSASRVWESMVS
jgi:phosphate transport system substrate-binding protein